MAPYLVIAGAQSLRGIANGDGDVIIHDVTVPDTAQVYWSPRSDTGPTPMNAEDFAFSLEVTIRFEEQNSKEDSEKRLKNMGYTRSNILAVNVSDFQVDIGKTGSDVTGNIADIADELRTRNDNLNPPARYDPSMFG